MLLRCRGDDAEEQRCRGGAVDRGAECRGCAEVVQWTEVQVQVQRCIGGSCAEVVQRSEVQRCRRVGAELVQRSWCIGGAEVVQRWRGAECRSRSRCRCRSRSRSRS